MEQKHEIILEGAEAKPLVLSAIGCPYFLIVQDDVTKKDRTAIRSHVSEGFDVGYGYIVILSAKS